METKTRIAQQIDQAIKLVQQKYSTLYYDCKITAVVSIDYIPSQLLKVQNQLMAETNKFIQTIENKYNKLGYKAVLDYQDDYTRLPRIKLQKMTDGEISLDFVSKYVADKETIDYNSIFKSCQPVDLYRSKQQYGKTNRYVVSNHSALPWYTV